MSILNLSIYRAFIISALLCLSPFNFIAYLSPFIFILVVLFYVRSSLILRNIIVTIFFILMILFFYKFIDNDFVIGNGLLAVLTYGSFLPLIIIPKYFFNNKNLFYKIIIISAPIIFLESVLGISQAIYGIISTGNFDQSFGDYVEGTIHPQFYSEKSMSNPIYAIILSTSLIFLYCCNDKVKNKKLILIFGSIAFILSAVNHLIIFLILSISISYLIFRPIIFIYSNKFLKLIQGIILLLFISVLIKTLSITNFYQLGNTAKYFLENRYPKTKIIYMFYDSDTNNSTFSKYIGLGPGQAISRASFISSGRYFGNKSSNSLESLFIRPSKFFDRIVDPLWEESLNNQVGSSTSSQIHSSWSAILTEFGLIFWILLIIIIIKMIINVKKYTKNNNDRYLGFGFSTIILYIFFMGIQQNYWEVTQAIFIPLIMLKILYSIITNNSVYEFYNN